MAQTIGQFITECENYQYSQEYYELLKECSELKLMERYLENQDFMEGVSSDEEFTEGFLMEAGNEETKGNVKKSFKEKSSSAWNKIVTTAKNLLKKAINFFTKIGNLFDEQSRTAGRILKYFAKNGVSDDVAKKIFDVYKHGIPQGKGLTNGFAFHKKQEYDIGKIDFSNVKVSSPENLNELKYIIAGSLSTTFAVISWPTFRTSSGFSMRRSAI